MSTKNASKQAKANNVVTPKNEVVPTATAVKQTKVITYIKEGMSGKMLQANRSLQNQSAKKQLKTISSCLTAIKSSEGEFLNSFVNYNVNDLIPKNLIPSMNDREIEFTKVKGFSTWLVLGLIKRFYEAKK
jgi:hypothetical protein